MESEKRKPSLFLQALIVAFCLLVSACLIGREALVPGTALILGRWLFLAVGLFFIYRLSKRNAPKGMRFFLLTAMVGILAEFAWNKINEETTSDTSSHQAISVMTYNVFFQNGDPGSALQVIKSASPDILVLQEVTPNWKKILDRSLAQEYPFSQVLPLNGTHGIGVFSKYPILSNNYLNNTGGLPFAQVLELQIGSKVVQMFNVHLASPAVAVENPNSFVPLLLDNYALRTEQADFITDLATSNAEAFDAQLLIGDLNTSHYEPLYRSLKSNWVNLFDESGKGSRLNFPNIQRIPPIFTLDYVFARGSADASFAKVLEEGSSDHFPVYATIEL